MARAVIYVPGLLWLGAILGSDKPSFHLGLIPFIPGDIVKAMFAALGLPAACTWLVPGDDR